METEEKMQAAQAWGVGVGLWVFNVYSFSFMTWIAHLQMIKWLICVIYIYHNLRKTKAFTMI